jgi:hypothetical protein
MARSVNPQADRAGSIGSSNKNHELSSNSTQGGTQKEKRFFVVDELEIPSSLQWIPSNCTWSKIKPVIRCAVAAWVSAVLFVIPRVEAFMGQVNMS